MGRQMGTESRPLDQVGQCPLMYRERTWLWGSFHRPEHLQARLQPSCAGLGAALAAESC